MNATYNVTIKSRISNFHLKFISQITKSPIYRAFLMHGASERKRLNSCYIPFNAVNCSYLYVFAC